MTKGAGASQFSGLTEKERECLEVLLEPNVKTYEDGARRLGIGLSAFKRRMQRIMLRYKAAQYYKNSIDGWKKKRRDVKRAKRSRPVKVAEEISEVTQNEEDAIPA